MRAFVAVVALVLGSATAGAQWIVTGPDSSGGPNVKTFTNSALDYSFLAFTPSFTGGVRVAAGDVNGDGTADIIVGTASGAAQVKVFDGVTLAEIRSFLPYGSFTGGVFVAAGDVNGDGFDDIVTGIASGAAPHVKVFDGQSGVELMSFFAFSVGFTGGVTVASGDIDGDGNADLVVGTATAGGQVRAIKGTAGTELANFLPFGSYTGGVSVAAGDITGDGRAEIVAGSATTSNVVNVYDGVTFSAITGFYAYTPGFSGGVRVAVGDVNGDHIPDLITGTGPGAGPHVKAFAGPSFADAASFFAYDVGFTAGIFTGGYTPKPTAAITGNTALCSGSATISVALTGRAPWSLVWNDGAVETGIQTASHQRTVNSTGTFTITRVGDPNHFRGTTAGSAAVIAGSPVSITTPPSSPTINPGETATLSVVASGATAYQWHTGQYPNGAPIQGATSSTYTTPALSTSTSYSVVVSNGQCSAAASARVHVRLPPPALFSAAGSAAGQATLSWTPVGGADSYEVWRRGGGVNTFAPVATPVSSPYTDTGLATSTSYLYYVRAMDADSIGGLPSAVDVATTITFADNPVIAGVSIIRAHHIEQLRTAVNAFRTTALLTPKSWTNVLVAGASAIKAVDVSELRTALNEARSAVSMPSLLYTDGVLNSSVLVRAVHVQELRGGVQ